MKKLIIPALLMSSAAIANVADLNYQPAAGKFHVSALGEYTTAEYDEIYKEEGEADIKNKYETTTDTLTMGLDYGIMDNLAVGLSFGYDFVADTEVDGKVSTKENGLKDPSLNLSYRALDNNGMMLDLNLGLDIALDDKEDNATRGGHTLNIGADVSQTWGSFTLMGKANIAYLMKATTINAPDAGEKNSNEDDSSMDFSVEAHGQYALSNEFSLVASAGYAMIGEADGKLIYPTESYKYTTDSYSLMVFGLGAKYAFNPEMAVKLGYTINMIDDVKTKFTADTIEQKDISSSTAYIGMDMAF